MEGAQIRSVAISALAHATEDKTKVREAMRMVGSGHLSRESQATKLKGHYGNEISILRATSASPREADQFLMQLWDRLEEPEQEQILSNLEVYVDSSGTLFLRVDKEEAIQGKTRLGVEDTIRVEVHFVVKSFASNAMIRSIEGRLASFQRRPIP